MARNAAEPGLTHYLEEIRRFPMLERQEEYMLAKRWREHGDRGAARADLGPSKQPTGLRVDHLEPDRDGAVPCAQHRDVPEDWILVMRALQVVVGDACIEVMHMVKTDVAREELKRPWQAHVRASAQRGFCVAPIVGALPVGILELVLDIEHPDAHRAGQQSGRRLDQQQFSPADRPPERTKQQDERQVGGEHTAPHAWACPARHDAWPDHHRSDRPQPEHHAPSTTRIRRANSASPNRQPLSIRRPLPSTSAKPAAGSATADSRLTRINRSGSTPLRRR